MIGELNERGERIVGDTLLILLNAHHEPIPFTLPPPNLDEEWELILDTARPEREPERLPGGHVINLDGRSLAVFRLPKPEAVV